MKTSHKITAGIAGLMLAGTGALAVNENAQITDAQTDNQELVALIQSSPACVGVETATTTEDIKRCFDTKQNKIQAINFEGPNPTVDLSGLTPEQVQKTIIIFPSGLKVNLPDIIK